MALTTVLYWIQLTAVHVGVFVVHLIWGLLFSKWLRTHNANQRKRVISTALAFFTCIVSCSAAYRVAKRSWSIICLALGFFFLGCRLCVYGLTGSIASGKSTVSRWLQTHLGATVIDADIIAREVLEPSRKAFTEVTKEFGTCILCPNSASPRINREALRELVFNDKKKRELLNKITHRYIIQDICWQVFRYRVLQLRSIVVLDAPLLFETPLHWICAPIIVVSVDEQSQMSRLIKRDRGKCDVDTLKKMTRSQMPVAEKCKSADILVDNSGTIAMLYDKLVAVFLRN